MARYISHHTPGGGLFEYIILDTTRAHHIMVGVGDVNTTGRILDLLNAEAAQEAKLLHELVCHKNALRKVQEELEAAYKKVQQLVDENATLREAGRLIPAIPGNYWTLGGLHKAVQQLASSRLPAFTHIDVKVSDTSTPPRLTVGVDIEIKPTEARILNEMNARYVHRAQLCAIFNIQAKDQSLSNETRNVMARMAKALST